jgi:hypothetical protein
MLHINNVHGIQENKSVNCVMQHVTSDLFSNSFSFCLQLLNSAGWCSAHGLWGSPKGNNHWDSRLVNMMPKTTHTQSALEINLTGHSCQTYHTRHPLYMGIHHPAGKMLCPHVLLPEWLGWPHFAVATATTGLLSCSPQRLVPVRPCSLIAHDRQCILQKTVTSPWICVDFQRPRTHQGGNGLHY